MDSQKAFEGIHRHRFGEFSTFSASQQNIYIQSKHSIPTQIVVELQKMATLTASLWKRLQTYTCMYACYVPVAIWNAIDWVMRKCTENKQLGIIGVATIP